MQLVGGQNVDHAAAVGIGLQQVVKVERGLAKKLVATLLLQSGQAALNGADAGRRDVAILRLIILGRIADVLQHGLQVFQVEQQQAAVVGNFEDERQNARLRVIQIQNAADEQRAHLRNRGADGMALLAEHIPERDRTAGEAEVGQAQLFDPVLQLGIVLTRPG